MNELELLETHPPRKLETIRPLIKSNRKTIQILLISAPLLFTILCIRVNWNSDLMDVLKYGIPIGLVLAAIPLYFAWALNFITKKSMQLLQVAIKAEGKIINLHFYPRAGLRIEVEFRDHASRTWKGKAVAGFSDNTNMQIGDPIHVFYDPKKPKLFVIYLPNIGLAYGGAKEWKNL